jgi:hypothetical protein
MKIRLVVAPVALVALVLVGACGTAPGPPPLSAEALSDDAAASAPLVGDDGGEDDGGPPTAGQDADSPAEESADSSGGAAAESGAPDAAAAPGTSAATAEGGPSDACVEPLAVGDLVIDELMIESVAGTGDYGEWVEIENTRSCTIDLKGLHGETSAGAKIRTFDVTADLWIVAGGAVLVADSADPTLNHDLPGMVLTWTGSPGDVLRNQGGTLTLQSGDVIIATVTWPAYKLAIGTSLELPADCSPTSGFGQWQSSVTSWFPGFRGTPNAPNVDVHCP